MIRDPCTYLLDEATSALDSQSEALVSDALATASRGKTAAGMLMAMLRVHPQVQTNRGARP